MWLVKKQGYREFDDYIGEFLAYLQDRTSERIAYDWNKFDPGETFWSTFEYVFRKWVFGCTDLEFLHQVGLENCIETIKNAEDPHGYAYGREAWMDVANGYDIARIACSVIFPKIITWDENARPEDYGYEPDTWVALVD